MLEACLREWQRQFLKVLMLAQVITLIIRNSDGARRMEFVSMCLPETTLGLCIHPQSFSFSKQHIVRDELDNIFRLGPGWFVQEVAISVDERSPCTADRTSYSIRFFEAFRLPSNATADNLDRHIVDTDSLASRPGTRGNRDTAGTMKYFDESVTGNLANGAHGFKVGAVPQAVAAPATYSQPPWWNDPPSGGEVVATRRSHSLWDCCCQPWGSRTTFNP